MCFLLSCAIRIEGEEVCFWKAVYEGVPFSPETMSGVEYMIRCWIVLQNWQVGGDLCMPMVRIVDVADGRIEL